MSEPDHIENEIREIIIMMNDQRFDGYMREGLRKRLEKIRDLINKELSK